VIKVDAVAALFLAPRRHRVGASRQTLNLLLVEDNGAVGRAIAKSLRAQGHTVTLVNNYADARATTGYFDVGVLDITLPDGDGIELCELLLKARRIGSALFCSGRSCATPSSPPPPPGRTLTFSQIFRLPARSAGVASS